MPETQIRRPDGSNTTIPELLQELAAKETANVAPRADENAGDRERFNPAEVSQRTPERPGR